MDVIYILKILWRKKWWLITIPLGSAVAAYFFSLSLADQYRSSTQIATGFTTNEAIQVGEDRYNPREVEMSFSNIMAAMNSGLCNNLLSYRLALHDLDSPAVAFREFENNGKVPVTASGLMIARGEFRRKLEKLEPLTTNDPNAELLLATLNGFDYGYRFLKENLLIYRIPNTDYIQVEFTSENPNLSAYTVNAFCQEFLRYYHEQKVEGSSISVSFFRQLVDQKKKELDEKSETLKLFKATNSFVNLNEEGSSRVLQISEFEKQKDEIESNIYGLNLKISRTKNDLARLERRSGAGQSGAGSRVVQLREQINVLNERYISSGNSVLLDSLNMLREQLKEELGKLDVATEAARLTPAELRTTLNDLQIELAIEESKLSSVESKLRNLKGSISGYASKEAVVASLQSEVDVASKEYLEAVNSYNEARNKLQAATGTVRQILRAAPPVKPIGSKRLLIVAAAGFTTLCFSVFVIVLLEFFDSTLKNSGQFKKILGLELAEMLIKVETQTLNFAALFGVKTNNLELEMFKEFVRKLRYQVESTNSRVFLLTSCKKGEGKTFVILTLAYVLSLVSKRVLIIDTNFKNNSLTKWLSIKKADIKYLERKRDREVKLIAGGQGTEPENDDGAYELVMPTRFKNVFFIGNNGGNDSPDEIISGRDFTRLINTLAVDYDYIFMEGAALNDYSDSKELIKYAEKVIPVFAADTSVGSLDRDSIRFLKSLGDKLSGCVLNKVALKNLRL